MAISKAEWEKIMDLVGSVDQVGIQGKFETLNKDIHNSISSMLDFVKEGATNLTEECRTKTDEAVKSVGNTAFSLELDKTLSVLEKHGFQKPIQRNNCCEVFADDGKTLHFEVYTVDLHDVLKYVSAYCQEKEKAKGFVEYRKVREQGLTERGNTRW